VKSFDLLGPLPTGASTTVLEASAGTGKTFTLAGLVTRYVAEGVATLDQMLLITFGRAASQELRERVRGQLVDAARALDDPSTIVDNELLECLVEGTDAELRERRRRLRDALAGFDAATIATTHQFCQLVLRSLGVAGDTDAGVTLVESLDELVTEVVDDLYLQRFGKQIEAPGLSRAAALDLALAVVGDPETELRPVDPPAGSPAALRVEFAHEVKAELERRKRRLGILGYDDLLSRLATALADPSGAARQRMRQRWSIVMVDEFQDTDPVQWQVIERAFVGHATVVLIGDPKQAIYAFRGGDIVTYLAARKQAGGLETLDVNWRSDALLVASLQVVLRGAALGHADIVVHDVEARHREHRLAGAPHNDPFRLRVVTRDQFGCNDKTVKMDDVRGWVARDLASDVAALLASDATYDGRRVTAGDVAVIVEAHKDARAIRDALAAASIPAVYTGDSDVFASQAGQDWLCLLEAFDQPHRSGLVRAAAATMFFGRTAQELSTGGEALTDQVAQTLREWADHARERGIAAVFEAARQAGMAERVLRHRGGERNLTDLAHLAQVLHETAHRERFGLPALLDWLRTQTTERGGSTERNRRLDSDDDAVQIMTVWVSKGLQYPLVYLPFAFNRHPFDNDHVLFHDGPTRCLHIGGKGSPDLAQAKALGRREAAGDDIRLTYVALTRAQSQVVAWWAPTWDEINGGLSRLLRGRGPGDATVPEVLADRGPSDADAVTCFRHWERVGGLTVERAVIQPLQSVTPRELPPDRAVRRFSRAIDTSWRRTSYSGLIRAAAESGGVSSEPEVEALDDEVVVEAALAEAGLAELEPSGADVPSPMADLPAGADFGSLVHGVLEVADPAAPDLEAELVARVREQLSWWPVDVPAAELGAALVPLHDTSLGPLAEARTLRSIGLADRLCELDFEIPLAGGDTADGPEVTLAEVGDLLASHLGAGDPLAPYADRLRAPGLAEQSLRGYLSGSIDVVLRLPGPRYLVVDYKTNRLGDGESPLTSADYSRDRVTEAMLHSDYPLQALLYVVVVHRYLRWRQPGYDPAAHLGGVLYLYVRGMCGPTTPLVDGHPAGVFSWQPPVSLVTALSDLLDRGETA